MEPYSRVYAKIHLDRIIDNIKVMKAGLREHTGVMAVVKADGYGHGAIPVAHAVEPYVEFYAAATVEEAVSLRKHGIEKPVLVLGVIQEQDYEKALAWDIRFCVFQLSRASHLAQTAIAMGKTAKVHLAVDTGMGRIGLLAEDPHAVEEAVDISRLTGLEVEGIFTHFARADEADKVWAERQLSLFLQFMDQLTHQGVSIPWRHCANSAAIIDMKQADLDLVRAGIAMYGLSPSDEVEAGHLALAPAMELKSCISYLKMVPAGAQISYGGIYTTTEPTRVATIPVGYADGYPRNLSGKGRVLIRGMEAKILGRICMDQFMVDVTHIPDAVEGDEVTLLGSDGDDAITVEEIAALSGGFHYELLCGISKRVPRVYVKEGTIVGTSDYFDQ
ncbi:MAG: alanine racemase [Lachnospiraceae bacterium]